MTFAEQMARIAEDCKGTGWDSYGAKPVTTQALAAVADITVTPTNRGGVAVSWNSEEASVEFDAEGYITAIYWDRKA